MFIFGVMFQKYYSSHVFRETTFWGLMLIPKWNMWSNLWFYFRQGR